ncbi:hypothetical protein B446_34290 [Streptomyces collinus Tu 365]|uniref:Uncharacterized protein n=1 Tax=Streptomyces collinus (strain DSM 40733 / Tue 365) TaxID=1214242 RepID=S5UVD4_STRC3|nr:hypothetical protein B446_01005 [Streptomyces collinus Tu 365]AGS73656.1 hypothetical protein B446_34290 [Streptomyces collinus Tu 365]
MTHGPQVLGLLHWHGEPPYGLTVLGIAPDRLAEAEEKAAAALADLALPASWVDAEPALRRHLVAACRPVPTAGLWHVTDGRPALDEDRARHDCLRALTVEWPGTEPLLTEEADRLPGLTALTRLTALVCRMPPEVWLEAEEDLLDFYDTYTVGTLSDAPP